MLHASGGVDPGGQNIADGGGGDRLGVAATGGHQGTDAQTPGLLQGLQTLDHQAAVFPAQGHDVGNGAQAEQIAVAPCKLLLVAVEGGGQLKGDAHAGKIGVGIGAVGTVGIHHGVGAGQGVLTFVVIRHHKADAQPGAQLRLPQGRDAAVDGDDHAHALSVQVVDGALVEAVALLQAAGNVADAVGAQTAQIVGQKTGGGDAVHVVVAENGDLCMSLYGLTHRTGSGVHFLHGKGVNEGSAAVQQRGSLLRRVVAPPAENAGGQNAVADIAKRLHTGALRRRNIPSSVLHSIPSHFIFSFYYNRFFSGTQ